MSDYSHYDDDDRFDTRCGNRLQTIRASLPKVMTRGATIILDGQPLFKSSQQLLCPRCRQEMKPSETTIRFRYAVPERSVQTVAALVCPCGESYVPGDVARRAYRAAMLDHGSPNPDSAVGLPEAGEGPTPNCVEGLRRRLEALLAAPPEEAVDEPGQSLAQIGAERVAAHRERVAAAGGELLGAAFRFLDQLVEKRPDNTATDDDIRNHLRVTFAERADPDPKGAPLNVGASDDITWAMARRAMQVILEAIRVI